MLIEKIQKLDEVTDDLARGDDLIRADASELDLQKERELAGRDRARLADEPRVHLGELFAQHEQLLRRERVQADDRREQVPCAGL